MRQLTDYIKEYPQALSVDVCNTIIERFEADDRKYHGAVVGDDNIKKSTDLYISKLPEWKDIDGVFFNAVSKGFEEYLQLLSDDLGYRTDIRLYDRGYQIQKTSVGENYDWHTDHCINGNLKHLRDNLYEYGNRIATYIIYLNDNFEGGQTQFFKDETCGIIPEKGKLMFFPANDLYIHRGDVVTQGAKYIMTGWMYAEYVCDAF